MSSSTFLVWDGFQLPLSPIPRYGTPPRWLPRYSANDRATSAGAIRVWRTDHHRTWWHTAVPASWASNLVPDLVIQGRSRTNSSLLVSLNERSIPAGGCRVKGDKAIVQWPPGRAGAWFKLRDEASRGPVSSDVPKLGDFLSYWLKDIVQPNLAPKTYQTYELFVRLHIVPHLGQERIDQLQVKDIRQWITYLPVLRASEGRCPAGIQATVLRDR
jgi:Phage integrase, N-terminal SAM-like domain